MEDRYPLARPLWLRMVGLLVVAGGLLVLLDTVVVVLASLPRWLLLGPAAVIAILVVVAAIATRRVWVVRLDDEGYAVRLVPAVGRASGPWDQVVEAKASVVKGMACLVLRRRDGQVTTIPVGLIEGDRDAFARTVQRRLGDAAARRTS